MTIYNAWQRSLVEPGADLLHMSEKKVILCDFWLGTTLREKTWRESSVASTPIRRDIRIDGKSKASLCREVQVTMHAKKLEYPERVVF